MDQNTSRVSKNTFCFDRFQADRERYQLRSGSVTLKLERIPLELLFLLLELRGKLVEREQIVARLWRDGSYLDTERSINTAVRKIRRALGDDPHQPKFVETVIGKGYRFIAPLVGDHRPSHSDRSPEREAVHGGDERGSDIRLRGFSVETTGVTPVLTCNIIVGKIDLGRLPLLEIELPPNVGLPLRAEDRLMIKLHGLRVTLTPAATQALHAFSISALEKGLRTRATDPPPASEDLREVNPASRAGHSAAND